MSDLASRRYAYVVLAALIANVLLSLAGIGFLQYGVSEGGVPVAVKGVYQGGNEVSVLFALIAFLLVRTVNRVTLADSFLSLLTVILIGLWLGTKTALAFAILGGVTFLWVVLVSCFRSMAGGAIRRLSARAGVLTSLSACCFALLLAGDSSVTDRWSVLSQKLQTDFVKVESVSSVVTSGRLATGSRALNSFAEALDLKKLFFGVGWERGKFTVDEFRAKHVESDPIDLLFAFGLVGVLLIYGYWVKLAAIARQLGDDISFQLIILSLALSILPGHVMYSSLAPIFLGLLVGGRLRERKLRRSAFGRRRLTTVPFPRRGWNVPTSAA